MADYCEGQFDSIRIGVCDIYWTPNCGYGSEIYLGLTKGGVELTYTPEFYDLTVDQYGKTPVDSVLIGEAVSVKIPLAETDLNKLSLFAPTATAHTSGGKIERLTFGQRPGLRLGRHAGVLRFHPVAMGDDSSEDVTIYRAVNKGALQLNYKLDSETIYELEIVALIDRNRMNGELLFEIGDPMKIAPPVRPEDIPDLPSMTDDYSLNLVPASSDMTTQPSVRHTVDFVVNCIYNYQVYNVSGQCTYRFVGDAVTDTVPTPAVPSVLLDATSTPKDVVTGQKFVDRYTVTAIATTAIVGGSYTPTGGTTISLAAGGPGEGTNIVVTLRATFGSKNQNALLRVKFNTM